MAEPTRAHRRLYRKQATRNRPSTKIVSGTQFCFLAIIQGATMYFQKLSMFAFDLGVPQSPTSPMSQCSRNRAELVLRRLCRTLSAQLLSDSTDITVFTLAT